MPGPLVSRLLKLTHTLKAQHVDDDMGPTTGGHDAVHGSVQYTAHKVSGMNDLQYLVRVADIARTCNV